MTCHSPAPMAIRDAKAREPKTNARTDQPFTVRGMPALIVSKKNDDLNQDGRTIVASSQREGARRPTCAAPKYTNSQLTCSFFALNTRNVFARSTLPWRFDPIGRRPNVNTAGGGRCSAWQETSKMLRLARH